MERTLLQTFEQKKVVYKQTSALMLMTIGIDLIGAIPSMILGLQDRSIALLGFGVNSLIRAAFGIWQWNTAKHVKKDDNSGYKAFDRWTLRMFSAAFFILAAGVAVASVVALHNSQRPESAFWGVVMSMGSFFSSWILVDYKARIGRKYNSKALLADVNRSGICLYIALVLFTSSIAYEIMGAGSIDSLGAIGIAFLSSLQGQEYLKG